MGPPKVIPYREPTSNGRSRQPPRLAKIPVGVGAGRARNVETNWPVRVTRGGRKKTTAPAAEQNPLIELAEGLAIPQPRPPQTPQRLRNMLRSCAPPSALPTNSRPSHLQQNRSKKEKTRLPHLSFIVHLKRSFIMGEIRAFKRGAKQLVAVNVGDGWTCT